MSDPPPTHTYTVNLRIFHVGDRHGQPVVEGSFPFDLPISPEQFSIHLAIDALAKLLAFMAMNSGQNATPNG